MTLLGLVSAITSFVKVRFLEDKAVIDTPIFRLHSRATACILFLACMLCSATSLLGDPIACMGGHSGSQYEKPLNTYCWISSTFTLPKSLNKPVPHKPLEGLGPYQPGVDKQVYHSYYQWVPFTLLFQGILFYLPHWLWKTLEQKRIHTISNGLRGIRMDARGCEETCERLADYLIDTLNCNIIYFLGYMFCDLLNLINVVGNIFLIDRFLGGVFLDFGIEVISFANNDQDIRTDPMIKIFPRLTKCTFNSYGVSGTIENQDLLCVMAINVINEKIYIFLWFWLFILCIFSIAGVVHNVVLVASHSYRAIALRKKFLCRSEAEFLGRTLPFGDYMLLNFLSYNIDGSLFDTLMQHLCKRLNYKGYNRAPFGNNPPPFGNNPPPFGKNPAQFEPAQFEPTPFDKKPAQFDKNL